MMSNSNTPDRTAWFKGGNARCTHTGVIPTRPWRIVLLGGPGVGKGTQAALLAERLNACHLSTGDVFRNAKSCSGPLTPALEDAIDYMQRGALVPDATVIDIVRERLHCLSCAKGFLLDGFPRTLEQAKQLDAMMDEINQKFDAVISYELDDDALVQRLTGRRTCKHCKATFHVQHAPSKKDGICDHCGGELYQREDDTVEVTKNRLKAYETEAGPVKDHYANQGILTTISAQGLPDQVYARTRAALEKLG